MPFNLCSGTDKCSLELLESNLLGPHAKSSMEGSQGMGTWRLAEFNCVMRFLGSVGESTRGSEVHPPSASS